MAEKNYTILLKDGVLTDEAKNQLIAQATESGLELSETNVDFEIYARIRTTLPKESIPSGAKESVRVNLDEGFLNQQKRKELLAKAEKNGIDVNTSKISIWAKLIISESAHKVTPKPIAPSTPVPTPIPPTPTPQATPTPTPTPVSSPKPTPIQATPKPQTSHIQSANRPTPIPIPIDDEPTKRKMEYSNPIIATFIIAPILFLLCLYFFLAPVVAPSIYCVRIPDKQFRTYCKNSFGSPLTLAKIREVEEVIIPGNYGVKSLEGIAKFKALKRLVCADNSLTNLDVSKNTDLTYLDCSGNELTKLFVGENTALEFLMCSRNDIITLDVSQNPNLNFLDCASNQLTSCNTDQNPLLEVLNCADNNIKNLNVNSNPKLLYFNYNDNVVQSVSGSEKIAVKSSSTENNVATDRTNQVNQSEGYTLANNTFLRSSMVQGVDHNKIAMIPYGSEFEITTQDSEWTAVKIRATTLNSPKVKRYKNIDSSYEYVTGYIATPFVLKKRDYTLLNSIFADDDSRNAMKSGRDRMALLNYYKDNGYYGKLSSSVLESVFSKTSVPQNSQWQFSSRNDAYAYYKANDTFENLGVMIHNIHTGDKKVLFFGFRDDETPYLRKSIEGRGDETNISLQNYMYNNF